MSDTKDVKAAAPVQASVKAPDAPAVVAAVESKDVKPKWTKKSLIGKRVRRCIEVLVDPLTGQVYEGDIKITEDNTSGWIVSQIEHGKAQIVD